MENKPINELTPDEISREITDRTGTHLHQWESVTGQCRCGLYYSPLRDPQPDFYHDSSATLKVMVGREDWPEFGKRIGFFGVKVKEGGPTRLSLIDSHFYLDIDYITEDGLLAIAALEFMRSKDA